ncbi:hypothetical protein PHYPSEUDO_001735 [Phytophthora pseudosyringae]|uniref:Rab-GAP TBC domain-containing protein n=1 Tax=Phytophthora pseudosyringae TaxID=221518 RepID=A0A8T1VZ58_9STRA|nr:hypothetical protein PHYPSEUDO_001735 [Phytophthora pseudosyringae]
MLLQLQQLFTAETRSASHCCRWGILFSGLRRRCPDGPLGAPPTIAVATKQTEGSPKHLQPRRASRAGVHGHSRRRPRPGQTETSSKRGDSFGPPPPPTSVARAAWCGARPHEWPDQLQCRRADYARWKRDLVGGTASRRGNGAVRTEAEHRSDVSLMAGIEKMSDVFRTRSELAFFAGGGIAQQQMLYILFVFAKLHPEIGYVQGMNEILAPLVCGSMTPLCGSIWYGPAADLYSFRWYMTLLAREFSMPDTLRVWDALLADPKRFGFLHYVNCALVRSQRSFLVLHGFSDGLKWLQNLQSPHRDLDIRANAAT